MPMQAVGQVIRGKWLTCSPDTAVAEAARQMRAASCDEIQGHLIGRPVSPGDLESLFLRQLLPLG